MLELGAALCQPRHHILFKGETLLLHSFKYELFEAVVFEILTHYIVKELVYNLRLAV